MNYIIEINYPNRDPIVFNGVLASIYSKSENTLKLTYNEHSTITHIDLSKCLYYSKIKESEYGKEKTISDLPKRFACR